MTAVPRICPICGRPALTEDAPPDVEKCMPSRCPSWETKAVYDHEKRQWLPTDPDGYVPDGRHMSEVR